MDREALNDLPEAFMTAVTITKFQVDREIAWTVAGVARPSMGHVYGYLLEPPDGTTVVTSYYDWSGVSHEWKEADIFPYLRGHSSCDARRP